MRGYYQLYKNYFEFLTTCHPELLHLRELCKVVFEIKPIEKAFGSFRSTAAEKHYLFRLIEYTYSLADAGDENSLQDIQGGFIVAKYHSNREEGSQAYCQAVTDSEIVALDFAEKMMADSKNGHPLFYHSANNATNLSWTAQVVRCVGDATYSGWLITFRFKAEMHNCIEDHPNEKWRQPTPFEPIC